MSAPRSAPESGGRRAGIWLNVFVAACVASGCVGPERQRKAEAKVDLGSAYLREGNPGSAITTLSEATEEDPRNWNAWQKLGLAYAARGAYDECDKAFKKSLHLQPDNAEVLNNYGTVLLEQKRTEEAVPYLEHALEDLEYRKPAVVLNNLGGALYQLGRYDEALARLNDAVARAPNLCPARFERALVQEARNEFALALTDFDAVKQLCGKDVPGTDYYAAEVLLKLNRPDEACARLVTLQEQTATDEKLADLGKAADALFVESCGG